MVWAVVVLALNLLLYVSSMKLFPSTNSYITLCVCVCASTLHFCCIRSNLKQKKKSAFRSFACQFSFIHCLRSHCKRLSKRYSSCTNFISFCWRIVNLNLEQCNIKNITTHMTESKCTFVAISFVK